MRIPLSILTLFFSLAGSVPAFGGDAPGAASQEGPAPYSFLDVKTDPEKLLIASEAYGAKDAEVLSQVSRSLGESPAAGYPEAWLLLLKLEKDPLGSLSEAKDFLLRHKGEYIAERFATDYLTLAAPEFAKNGDWSEFDAMRSRLKWNADSENFICWDFYREAFSAKKDELPKLAARRFKLMANPRAQNCAPCVKAANLVISRLKATGFEVLLANIARNNQARAKAVLEILIDAKYLSAADARLALTNPTRWMNRHRNLLKANKRSAMIAAYQFSRVNVDKSARLAAALAPRMSAQERAALWSRIAESAAKSHMKETLSWYAKAGPTVCSSRVTASRTACLEWRVRTALREGRWKSVKSFIRALPEEARTKPSWIYWEARSEEALGQKKTAEALYKRISASRSFYGKLAREELGLGLLAKAKETHPVGADAIERASGEQGVILAKMFYDADLPYEGHREWNWSLRGDSAETLIAKALWAGQNGLTHRMINTAERVQGLAVAPEILYPRPYLETISSLSKEYRVPISWVYGVIRQESRFILTARSRVGANGLMQLMPATAQWVAAQSGMEDFRPEKVNLPEINLRLGTAYLRLLLDRLDNDTVLATAGYNAGPHRAIAWRRTLVKPVEGAVFVETIPFDETRTYVQNVLANMAEYSRFNKDPLASLKKLLGRITPTKSTFNGTI